MSLHKAVYQTVDVPYREVGYYADITQPTPNLVGFLARSPGGSAATRESLALFHLDQGMGGGKSHALVGLYHMATNPRSSSPPTSATLCAPRRRRAGATVDLTGTRAGHADRRPLQPRESRARCSARRRRCSSGSSGGCSAATGPAATRYVARGPNKAHSAGMRWQASAARC